MASLTVPFGGINCRFTIVLTSLWPKFIIIGFSCGPDFRIISLVAVSLGIYAALKWIANSDKYSNNNNIIVINMLT